MSDTKVAIRPYIIGPTASFFMVPSATYTGPGDIFAFEHWWGMRAYSQAKAGTSQKLVTVYDLGSTASTFDLVSKTNGEIDLSPLSAVSTHSFSPSIVYDQVGSNNMTPTSTSNPIIFTQTAMGTGFVSYLAFVGFGTNNYLTATLSSAVAAPHTWSTCGGQANAFDTGVVSDSSSNWVWFEIGTPGVRASGDRNASRLINNNNNPLTGTKMRINTFIDTIAPELCTNASTTSGSIAGAGATVNPINWGFTTGLGDGSFDMMEFGIGTGGSSANCFLLDANQQTYWGIP